MKTKNQLIFKLKNLNLHIKNGRIFAQFQQLLLFLSICFHLPLLTLCGNTMFTHFVVPILQRGVHFNLKISNDNCSSLVKCKCTVTECECLINKVLNRIAIGNYISRQKRRTFLFFSHSMLSIRLVKNYCAFTFFGTPFRIIVHRRVEHFFCFSHFVMQILS